jgi:hypothetical protein
MLPTLLAVNHTFQSVANGTPQLWSRLAFDINKGQIDIRYTRDRLRRSGVLPLDIRIYSYDTTYEQVAKLVKLLRREVARFRTLELNVPSYSIAEKILHKIGRNQPAPLLERLHIFYNQASSYPSELSLRNVFCSSPRLTHTSLPADPLPPIDSLSLFSTVTTIVLDTDVSVLSYRPDEVVTFVSVLPLLKHLKFKGVDDTFDDIYLPYETVPHLLSVDMTVPGYGLDILCHLEAPSLTHMRLDGRRPFRLDWDDSMATALSVALRYLATTSPLITRLELVSTKLQFPGSEYAWIFSGDAFPSLKSLRLEGTDITDGVLRECTRLCNNLKRLELWACQGVTGPGLIQFVQEYSGDFELLLDSCPNVTEEHIATLSSVVKVETASNAFEDHLEDLGQYYPWVFNWTVSGCRFCLLTNHL